jgi:hypothetical protein
LAVFVVTFIFIHRSFKSRAGQPCVDRTLEDGVHLGVDAVARCGGGSVGGGGGSAWCRGS